MATLVLILLLVAILVASAVFMYRIGKRQAEAKLNKKAAEDAEENNRIGSEPFVDNPLDRMLDDKD
jgi:hypothetical protein